MTMERFDEVFKPIEENSRYADAVAELRARVKSAVTSGQLPGTEEQIVAPSPEEIETAELKQQADIIVRKYASVYKMSEDQFREQVIPKDFPVMLRGQEILTLPKLVVIPNPKYLSVKQLFEMEGVDISADFSQETLRQIELWTDQRWAKLPLPQGPVAAVRVANPEPQSAYRGQTVDAVRKELRPPLRPGTWEALALLRDDPDLLNRIHLHMPGLNAGTGLSPRLYRWYDGRVELHRNGTDGASGCCGVVVAGVNFELGSWKLGS